MQNLIDTELAAVVKVKKNGQITLPITIREALGIREGDIVELRIKRCIRKEMQKVTNKEDF